MGDGQRIVQQPFHIGREIVGIGHLGIGDGLDLGIHGGYDPQTAGIQHEFRLGLVIACRQQILFDLLLHGVHKVAAGGTVGQILNVVAVNSIVHIVGHGFVILFLADKIQPQHVVQACFPALGVSLGMTDGIVAGWILGNGSDYRAFRQGQFAAGFAKIPLGRRLYPQSVLSQVDGVHIAYQDLVLAQGFGQFNGQVLFLEFPLDLFDQIVPLRGPTGKNGIFQELLGDGAGSLGLVTQGFNKLITGAQHGFIINTIVLIEALVLQSHKGMGQIFRNLVLGHDDPVGVDGYELVQLVAFAVIHEGSGTYGSHIVGGDLGSGSQDPFVHTDACGSADDAQTHKADQAEF
ncbi:hypothetical protein IMSAGC003_03405 [Lachnospiraceae bacterium]|nr:hypothetical protein IMSAGC003_03405 [Lachnospiraceae bacterium]